jgi:L-fucose isomerase-like protein
MATLEKEFDAGLKEKLRGRYRKMFETYVSRGVIHGKSLFFGEIVDEKGVLKACEAMTDSRADGIVFHPLTWPAGEVITALAAFRYLRNIPLFVSASPEVPPDGARTPHSWPQNSDCGKLFANSIFHKLDRKTLWSTGLPEEEGYDRALRDFFTVCRLIRRAGRARVAVIGNVLDDFPESFYNPLAVRRETGVRVMEIDSSVLFTLFERGEYSPRGLRIEPGEIAGLVERLRKNIDVRVSDETLSRASRLYLCYKAIVESVSAEGAVFRCAPELQERHGLAACGAMAQLIDNGVIHSGGCEGDVLNTVTGLLQYYASGEPTTCLDWIDRPGAAGEGVYTLLHCGNACKTMLQPGKGTLDYHQAWTYAPLGYTIEGPIRKGPVTIARLRENREGRFELLVVEGESVAEEMRIRGNFGLVRLGEERLRTLELLLNENGWPHHLSLGWGHHGAVLEKAAKLLGDIRVVKV